MILSIEKEDHTVDIKDVPSIDTAKLTRKIDLRVMPMLTIIYFIAFLDRVNIGNALTLGLPSELKLRGQQPNIALSIFFVPYVLFEIPSNIVLKKVSPRIWLSTCIFAFGIVMLGQGFVKNLSGLIATRFFLGFAEAGILPGSFYLISFWYTHEQAQRRFTVYWTSTIIAGAFGNLLATGISRMGGIGGLSNWRWLFIIEGLLTIVIAAFSFFFVANFPADATWLTPEEKEYIAKRNHIDAGSERITAPLVKKFFKDPKSYVAALMYFGFIVPAYSAAYFLPTIIQALGYSVLQTQLHAVPPYAATLVFCLILAYASDRTRVRLPFALLGWALMIVGLSLLLRFHGRQHFSVEYGAVVIFTMGSLSMAPIVICWYLMNLRGHAERSLGSGWMISFGNTGGLISTFAFVKAQAPVYHTGYAICMGMTVMGTVASLVYGYLVHRDRQRLRRDPASAGLPLPSL